MAYNPYDYGNSMRQDARFNVANNQPQYQPNNFQTYGQIPLQNNFNVPNNVNPIQGIMYECRPVTSIDEARATAVRMDGNPIFMIDVNAKSIYEKKLDMNSGAALLKTYIVTEDNQDFINKSENINIDLSNVAKKEDFDILNEKVLLLTQKNDEILDTLKSIIFNGGDNNEYKSNGNDGNVSRGKSNNVNTTNGKK